MCLKLFALFTLCLVGCSFQGSNSIKRALKVSKTQPYQALEILDKEFQGAQTQKEQKKLLEAIEHIVHHQLKNPNLLKKVLLRKHYALVTDQGRNKNLLVLAQLLVQNLKDEVEALNQLSRIQEEHLNAEQRELFFHLTIMAYTQTRKYPQALVEIQSLQARKDLTPSERFKIGLLKAKIHSKLGEFESVEATYKKVLVDFPNLSKKWKIRSQLALALEDQKKYVEALAQLKAQHQEEGKKDPVLALRIKELAKRQAKQPGARGWLKK